jgi:23S rRNA pseudouridine1911/1915/1917 synthase
MTKKKYVVDADSVNTRIDSWLALQLAIPRNQIKRLLETNDLLVNDRPATSHYMVKENDVVIIKPKKVVVNDNEDVQKENPKEIFSKIKIVAETDEYVVLNKPAGLLMHPASNLKVISLVDWLLEKYPKIRSVGEDPLRPGIMHRLDREVSGLVVIAKNQTTFDSLKQQFKDRLIKKEYTALVHGADLPEEGEINFLIERSSQGYKMAAKPINQTGKTAITTFTVEKRFHNYTLLKVGIKTGRTHQIRVHFSAYTHPVVGDDLYTGQKLRALNKKLNLGRLFLAATKLSFLDQHDEFQTFSLKLPKELQTFLAQLT